MQGPKSKKTLVTDSKEETENVSNDPPITNENGGGEMDTHPISQNDCCPEVGEKVEDVNGADDPRPLKKGKPLTDETCDFIEETNGFLYICGIF